MRRRVFPLAAAAMLLAAVLVWATAGRSEPPLPVADPIVVGAPFRTVSDHLGRGETLSHMFARHGVQGGELLSVLSAARAEGLNPRAVLPSQEFEFRTRIAAKSLDQVRTRISDEGYLVLRRDPAGDWTSGIDRIEWTVTVERVTGSIESSLNAAVHGVVGDDELPFGERDRLIWNAAENVYGWVIDFTRDPRPGDRFSILYERQTSSDGDVRFGRILAARIEIQKKEHAAYVLPDGDGRARYYDETGRSLHGAFLMYPVQFRRIASTFSRRRFHPVLKRYRAHLGYDFSADTGTPIRTTGDGTVHFTGRNGSYGLMVTVRHAKGIETRYAHMSRVATGMRAGVRVKQGQIIGYVGMTGMATGPHVHYEFLRNGQHVNYRDVDLGDGEPVAESLTGEFARIRELYERLMNPAVPSIPVSDQ